MYVLASNTNSWKQVICCASEPNEVSVEFCGLPHSADTMVLSDRVPASSHKQLGSVSELSWKGIFSEKTFMGFFPHHVFWTNILKCVLLPAQTTEVLLPFLAIYVSIYTPSTAIFKIWHQSTVSLMLLIHVPHSRTFWVQNVAYNSSTETGIQQSAGFAVINVQKFPPQKYTPQIYTLLFSYSLIWNNSLRANSFAFLQP